MAKQHRKVASVESRTERIERLKTEYDKLTRQANRRLTSLEKLAEKNPEYKSALSYAYKLAQYDIHTLFGDEKNRYDRSILKASAEEIDIRDLSHAIASAENFLNRQTSTKSGIDRAYKNRADSINKKYGTDFSVSDMGEFFESRIYKKLSEKMGSRTAMRTIAKIQKNAKSIIKEIDTNRKRHRKVSISDLQDVNGLDIDAQLNGQDKRTIEKLARLYEKREGK